LNDGNKDFLLHRFSVHGYGRGGCVNLMNIALVIIILCSLVYALAFRLGVRRGRKESWMSEYRRGYSRGYDRARKELSDLFNLPDGELLLRVRELRRSAGK
jgi:hypothetical protein